MGLVFPILWTPTILIFLDSAIVMLCVAVWQQKYPALLRKTVISKIVDPERQN